MGQRPKDGRYLQPDLLREDGPEAKRLRLEKGLKQGEVAKAIGTTGGNLSRFEKGVQGISWPLLLKLTALLGTTPDGLNNLNSLSLPSEIKDVAVMLMSLNENQFAGVMGLIAALNLDNKSQESSGC
jgi:transcriptional regulator with XRE-family HTH domain